MQCYVTHDATTHGIRRGIFQRETIKPAGAYILIDQAERWFPDKSWFVRYGSAIRNAEKQRLLKIHQLEKQIEKIRRMEFK